MTITYQRATIKDLKELYRLNNEHIAENYPMYLWESLLTDMDVANYVALDGGTIVGYILLCRTAGLGQWLFQLDHDKYTLISLVVHPDHRRQGIATQLLARSLDYIKHQQPIVLHVRKSNPIINLYHKYGFVIEKTVSKYYTNPTEDGYQMVLEKNLLKSLGQK